MWIGVDVGGSGVRAAAVDNVGITGKIVTVSLADRGVDAVVDALCAAVQKLPSGRPVGVGMPGFVQQGVVLRSPNFPAWRDVRLAQRLRERLGVVVVVDNDANAAALGAAVERLPDGVLLVLTLGTGVGGGVVLRGRPYRGGRRPGAELGHVYAGGERPCGCGGLGCLETWCSTTGLVQAAAEAGVAVSSGKEVVERARAGETWARAAMQEAGRALGRGLCTLVNAFGPDEVLLLGGLAAAEDLLGPPALGWFRERAVAPLRDTPVHFGARADADAILGAAALVRAGGTAARIGTVR